MREYSSVPAEGDEPEVNPLDGVGFVLDGERFECKGRLSVAEMAELARQGMSGGDTADAAMLALLAEPLAQAFGQAEYDRFRVHCRGLADSPDPETGAARWIRPPTPDAVWLQIMSDLNEEIKTAVEAAAGRPTQPQSRSGSGEPVPDARISRVINMGSGDVTVTRLPEPQDRRRPAGRGRPPVITDAKSPRRKRTG